jgi:hypothetical protein
MESESSDLLRFPTAGEATRLGCAWGDASATSTHVVPRADQSNTWFLLPTWTSQHLPGPRQPLQLMPGSQQVVLSGEQCLADFSRVSP